MHGGIIDGVDQYLGRFVGCSKYPEPHNDMVSGSEPFSGNESVSVDERTVYCRMSVDDLVLTEGWVGVVKT